VFGPEAPATNAPVIDGTGRTNSLPQTNGPTGLPPITLSPFAPGSDGTTGGAGAGDLGGALAGSLAAQGQALQASGERLRAVVEQNTSLTNALFLRTLDLIDGQNRKLGEVDRKISELSNQIKSLKNP
jgi:hypothetical protein